MIMQSFSFFFAGSNMPQLLVLCAAHGAKIKPFFALQGLWAIPFLFGSTGETFDSAAFQMLLATITMTCGW
jgi:hypothetical protein